jgi:hypothetical protein
MVLVAPIVLGLVAILRGSETVLNAQEPAGIVPTVEIVEPKLPIPFVVVKKAVGVLWLNVLAEPRVLNCI